MQKEERTLQKTMRARVIVRVLVGYDLNTDGGGIIPSLRRVEACRILRAKIV